MIIVKKITGIDKKLIKLAIDHLRAGNLLIYPTDTSYGLGGLISSKAAIEKIDILKKRDESKYYSVIAPNFEWITKNLEVNTKQEEILREYLPGAYTFILDKKGEEGTLGVRIPKMPFIQLMANQLGEPLTATSANIGGQADAYSLEDLQKGISRQETILNYDILVLDNGPLKTGGKSTIVDLTKTPPIILRQGSGTFSN